MTSESRARDSRAAERRARLGPTALEHIRRLVDDAPPLTGEQVALLSSLFRGARRSTASTAQQSRMGQRAA